MDRSNLSTFNVNIVFPNHTEYCAVLHQDTDERDMQICKLCPQFSITYNRSGVTELRSLKINN